MNNLVDYGPDSDEESPRRRSSEGQSSAQKFKEAHEMMESKRKRRSSDAYGDDDEAMDFAEPPAPKRHDEHSPSPAAFRTPILGMPHATSTASLVSYSGDGDDDDDSGEGIPKIPGSTPLSELHEPAPPIRQSRDDVDEDEEQKLIDLAIREGNEAIMRMNHDGSPMDTPGHDSVVDSPFSTENVEGTPSHASDSKEDQELRVPPAPNVEVNPELITRFEKAFRQKAQGVDLNQQIQGNPKYNNPMIYTTFIETFNIDEKGTNFAKNIFDPHVFPENCFYNAIAEEQRKLQEPPKKK
uniref:HCNGP-like protein n=1 Tax=Caenorhabditis tropicalis TaxID=1561998 RepID=A0A1I7UXD3_9PELO